MPNLTHTLAYRIVYGAVRNVLDGHRSWSVPSSFARSVAKRASGTLLAHTAPEALAAIKRSDRLVNVVQYSRPRGVPSGCRAHPLPLASKELTKRIGAAKRAGEMTRFVSLCSAARIIKREIERDGSDPPDA